MVLVLTVAEIKDNYCCSTMKYFGSTNISRPRTYTKIINLSSSTIEKIFHTDVYIFGQFFCNGQEACSLFCTKEPQFTAELQCLVQPSFEIKLVSISVHFCDSTVDLTEIVDDLSSFDADGVCSSNNPTLVYDRTVKAG